MLNSKEMEFMKQSELFLELFLKERSCRSLTHFQSITGRPPFPISPVMVCDFRSIELAERAQILKSYAELGVAHLIVLNPDDEARAAYPLFDICEQLKDDLHLHHPLEHPLEGHPEAVSRFGPADGAVKIYNLPKDIGGKSYREVAETSDAFEVHSDGLGSGGTVQTVILYEDQPPLFGGFTFFYDLLSLGVELAKIDMEAFRHLFLPDAFTAIRPRGKGAIKVVSPVFYINENGQPQVFYRRDSGEYRMLWKSDCPPIERARKFLHSYTAAFSPGSNFVPFTHRGQACFARNRDMAHGRTAFIDGPEPSQKRVLSRKWFMTAAKHSEYKHVPGMAIDSHYAAIYPEQFGADKLEGEWLYNVVDDRNCRVC